MAYWLHCQSCMEWSKSNTPLSDDKSCPFCNSQFRSIKPFEPILPDILTAKPKGAPKKANILDDAEFVEASMPPDTDANEAAELAGQAFHTEENNYVQTPKILEVLQNESPIVPAVEAQEQIEESEEYGIVGTDDSAESAENDEEQDITRVSDIPETQSVGEEDEPVMDAPIQEDEKAPETIEAPEVLETNITSDNSGPGGEEVEATEDDEAPVDVETPDIPVESENSPVITQEIAEPLNIPESGRTSETQETYDSTQTEETDEAQGVPEPSEMPEAALLFEDSNEAIFVYIVEDDDATAAAETTEKAEVSRDQALVETCESDSGEEPDNIETTQNTNSTSQPKPNEIRINFTFGDSVPLKSPQEADESINSLEVVENLDSSKPLEVSEMSNVEADPELETTDAPMEVDVMTDERISETVDANREPEIQEVPEVTEVPEVRDEQESLEKIETESIDIQEEAAAVPDESIETTAEMKEESDLIAQVDTPENNDKNEMLRMKVLPRMTRTYESYIEMRRRSRGNNL